MRQKFIDDGDGASLFTDCIHASTLRWGSSHTSFGTDPVHTPKLTEGSCEGPISALVVCGQKTQFLLHKASEDGKTLTGTVKFCSKEGMKRPRRIHDVSDDDPDPHTLC